MSNPRSSRRAVLIGLLALCGANGCASVSERVTESIRYFTPPRQAGPGEVFQLNLQVPSEVQGGRVSFNGRPFQVFFRHDLTESNATAFIPLPGDTLPGPQMLDCEFRTASNAEPVRQNIPFQVRSPAPSFQDERVKVKDFSPVQYQKEQTLLRTLLQEVRYATDQHQGLLLPMRGRIVTAYRTRRTYGPGPAVVLDGIELLPYASASTEVKASADGLVVLAQDLPMLGRTVVVDHGLSFATVCTHLKSLQVKKGQTLQRGQRLGEVGRTGRAAVGERLGYAVFVAGQPIDPSQFTEIPRTALNR